MCELALDCGGDHDKLILVGEIGVAERPMGGLGTAAAKTDGITKNKRPRTSVNMIGMWNLFLVLAGLCVSLNYSGNLSSLLLWIVDKSYGKVF